MNSDRAGNWWARPCGGREVLVLALPLVISTASWTVMNFVDRMFLLWFCEEAMAAAMPAGMLYFTLICFPLGVAMYVNTFVAQYEGAGRPGRIGAVVWQGIRVGVYAMPVFLATIPLAPWIFALAGHDPQVACFEVIYYQVLCFGAVGQVIATSMSSFFSGRGQTRTVMAVDTAASLLNVALDYAWIFGHWGFPSLGIEGAAWATVVSQWSRVAMYGYVMMRPALRQKYQLIAARRFDAPLMRRLLRYGGPNGLQLLVEVSAFSLFILLVGRLGTNAMAATTLAFNVNSVAWVPMLGMGIALTTMVGQQLGRDRPDLAARATWTSFCMAQAYLSVMAALYVTVPDLFLMGHASGTDPVAFALLRDTTVVLLRFVAAYSLLDAMNIIFVHAIKGAGDTRFILIVSSVTAPLPVTATWLGVARLGLGLIWCWLVITAWICALGVIYLVRFLQGRWRQMRVIEPELLPLPAPCGEEAAVEATVLPV
ncbi:MAG: MATE family efflux transporter [Pirellulales bacterium]|nr:MATE family efflux transporter [Pirellulales bacterium]